MLVTYSMTATHVQTTLDYLLQLKAHLGFDTEFVHVTHDAIMGFDIQQYDVIFHNYCARLCFDGYVSESYTDALQRFRGVKVLAVQDEYDRTNLLKAAIKRHKFDIVLTCVPQSQLEYVYPRADFPGVDFVTVFTGYVPDSLAESGRKTKPIDERPIFIGYRGRDIGGRYGRLGFDKFEIGRRMKAECDARGIPTDIAMDEASRIYGTAWFDFVGNCRAMLGTESGSNVFDFDGSIEEKYKAMVGANGGRPPTYEEFLDFVAEREREMNMGQISPRVFECAALRTPMVLYRGYYSDVVEPETHYIALEKDFSNVEEVLSRLRDSSLLDAMTERTYQHLIASGEFSYRAFCRRVRQHIDAKRATKASASVERVEETRAQFVAEQCGKVLEGRDRVLAERPTLEPRPLSAFYAKQARLVGLTRGPEVERLDWIYGRAVKDFETSIDATLRIHERAARVAGPEFERQSVASMHAPTTRFRHSVTELRQHRADYLSQQQALQKQLSVAEEGSEARERTEIELNELNGSWITTYAKLYGECSLAYSELSVAIQNACRELTMLRRTDLVSRLRWKLCSLALSAASFKGSKWQLAKAIVGRSPVLTRLVAPLRRLR